MDDDQEIQTPPNTAPALGQISQVLTDPDAQDAIGEAAIYLNDHVQQRRIADANEAAGENFVNDMATFKQGLQQFVTNDPTGVHAAMKAVVPVVSAVASSIPGAPADQLPGHIDAITRHMQQEIATTAVSTAAEHDEGLARSLLDHGNIAPLLPQETRDSLGGYIDMQAQARATDRASQQAQQAQLADAHANNSMFNYAAQLYDPQSGSVTLPPKWNQQILADNSVTPADTAGLRALYARLSADGGATASDPFLLANTVRDIASGNGPAVRDVLGHAVNGNLTLDDALHLASLSTDKSDRGRDHASGLADVLQQGRDIIMGQDGENGAAGARAYGRFVNWAVPTYKRTGVAGANPEEPGYLANRIGSFLPGGDDMVPPAKEARRPLKEIFGGR